MEFPESLSKLQPYLLSSFKREISAINGHGLTGSELYTIAKTLYKMLLVLITLFFVTV